MPDSPLSSGFESSTDALTAGGLCCHATLHALHGGEDGRIGLAFLDDETVADLVTVLEVGRKVVCHVASMGQDGTESKGSRPVPRLSHPVEHLSDRLTVLFFSLEDATVNGLGELTHLSRGGHIVPTLGVDLGDVGVRSGFVHADILVTGVDGSWVQVDGFRTGPGVS